MKQITCPACGQQNRINEKKTSGMSELKCQKCHDTIPFHFSDIKTVPWKGAIQIKISLSIMVITTIILSGYFVFSYVSNNKKLTDELDQFTDIVSIRLSQSLIMPLWEVDEEQVLNIIDSEMLTKQIYAVIVKEGDLKSVFQGGKRDEQWEFNPSKSAVSGDYIFKEKIIKRGNQQIGAVEVYVTDKFMKEKSKNTAISMAYATFILILCILATVYITLKFYIITPITKLTNAAEQISLGRMDVDLSVRSRDEIGSLAQAIERMRISLKLSFDRLHRG